MNLITIFHRFPDQQSCIEHLEEIRWRGVSTCPLCESDRVEPKSDGDRVGRWNCHHCHRSFNVLSGTILSKTKVPLQKWFLAISMMANAKKSMSSHQLARDLNIPQTTALYMQQRIRAQMAKDQAGLLQGIVEADETYIGGKPRYKHPRNPRGRGTSKTPVIGAVERGGRVVAKMATDLTGKGILGFIKQNVAPAGSVLITDQYKGYSRVKQLFHHAVVDHSKTYVDGNTHTNTIEGVWALLKRAWYGSHHHYTRRYTPLYVAEACFKYNHRNSGNGFSNFLVGCFS